MRGGVLSNISHALMHLHIHVSCCISLHVHSACCIQSHLHCSLHPQPPCVPSLKKAVRPSVQHCSSHLALHPSVFHGNRSMPSDRGSLSKGLTTQGLEQHLQQAWLPSGFQSLRSLTGRLNSGILGAGNLRPALQARIPFTLQSCGDSG